MFSSQVLKLIEEAKKLAKYNHKKTIDERIMKTAIRLNPGADSLLPIANSYEKNLSKAHLDMFKDAIMPLRSSAKAKMMLGGILSLGGKKSPGRKSPLRKSPVRSLSKRSPKESPRSPDQFYMIKSIKKNFRE